MKMSTPLNSKLFWATSFWWYFDRFNCCMQIFHPWPFGGARFIQKQGAWFH